MILYVVALVALVVFVVIEIVVAKKSGYLK